jgi:hypothetical protein
MQVRIAIVVGVLSLVGAEVAPAATLYSPVLKAGSTNNRRLQCSVVNVSSEPKKANFQIISQQGKVLSPATVPTTVPPGAMLMETANTSTRAYCKAVVTGLKSDWRGAFELQFTTNNLFETSVSVPLQ